MTTKLFVATFPGCWIGGNAVILAPDKRTARRELKKALKPKLGIGRLSSKENLIITEVDIVDTGTKAKIVYLDDGDY